MNHSNTGRQASGGGRLDDALRGAGEALGVDIATTGTPIGLRIEGAGAVDLYVPPAGDCVLLRAVLMPGAPDGALRRAMALNAAPRALAGGALGLDDGTLVLTAVLEAPHLTGDLLAQRITDFASAAGTAARTLSQHAPDAGDASDAPADGAGWIRA
ncbi:MAG: type III secretion system chaperone [Paracoccaceae bacterium]